MNRTKRVYLTFVSAGAAATLLMEVARNQPIESAIAVAILSLLVWTIAFLILAALWRPALLALRRVIDRQLGAQ